MGESICAGNDMNEQEFLKLLNAIIKKVRNYSKDAKEFTSMTDNFLDVDVDSLEMMMINMHLQDALKFSDKVADAMDATTAKELYDFLLKSHVEMPDTAEDALSIIAQ